MDKRETAQMNMIDTTISYCENNTTATAGISAFATALAQAKSKYNTANQLNQLTLPGTKGVTSDTKNSRLAVANLAFKPGSGLSAYAGAINDQTLRTKVKYSVPAMMRLSKEDFDDVVDTILKEAIANLAAAGAYGYDNTDVTALTNALNIYLPKQQDPRQAKIAIATANEQIKETIRLIIDTFFKAQLDGMVGTLKASDPTFYSNYFKAREIVDLPTSKANLTGIVTDNVTTLPLANADATVYPLGNPVTFKSVKSNASGIYLVKPLPPGDYTVVFTFPGYFEGSKNFTISAGETVTINVNLNPAP